MQRIRAANSKPNTTLYAHPQHCKTKVKVGTTDCLAWSPNRPDSAVMQAVKMVPQSTLSSTTITVQSAVVRVRSRTHRTGQAQPQGPLVAQSSLLSLTRSRMHAGLATCAWYTEVTYSVATSWSICAASFSSGCTSSSKVLTRSIAHKLTA